MAKYSQTEIDKLGKAGKAFGPDADGHYSYPIADREDLENAVSAVGRGNADHAAIRRFIMRRAKHMGQADLIPDNWNADGSLRDAKSRWTGAQRRQRRGGLERRAGYAGRPESRSFRVAPSGVTIRAATSATPGLLSVSGSPIVYDRSYTGHDELGTFAETMAPGVVAGILSTCDCRFLINHEGLPLARTTSGTLKLVDSASALQFTAQVDPRQNMVNDLAIALQRQDVTQMSVGFVVAQDTWLDDFSVRTITRIGELLDISAVTYPASPTTSIALVEDLDEPDPGDQGDQMAPFPYGGMDDGSGSRSARRLALELDVLELELQDGRPAQRRK